MPPFRISPGPVGLLAPTTQNMGQFFRKEPYRTAMPASAARSEWKVGVVRLDLIHPWTTTMSTSDYRETVHVSLTCDGRTGLGEGAPIMRYEETPEGSRRIIQEQFSWLSGLGLGEFGNVTDRFSQRVPGHFAAKAAVDTAVFDWTAQGLGVPLCRMLGLDPEDTPITSYSIGIDTPEATREKILEVEEFPVLKVKLGLASDESTMDAVRHATNKTVRVDVNEGWKDVDTAVRKIRWLESLGVEFVEQPMPAERTEEMRTVRRRVNLPIFADEAAPNADALPGLVGAYDGVNIKLDKCGGIREALRMIHAADTLGLKTMLGCMVSSSVGITAAAHLSPLVDYADLDGNLLVANDPYRGVTVRKGKLILPRAPGLGVVARAETSRDEATDR